MKNSATILYGSSRSGLLNEEGIHPQKTDCSEWKKKKIFFLTAGDMPFDIFAASFYLLSRYEEYLPHEKDQYGRYSHVNSHCLQRRISEYAIGK
jgi:hypothetical protein